MSGIIKNISEIFIGFLLLGLLTACGSSDEAGPEKLSNATTEIPTDLQKLTLPGGGTLRAFVTIDGDTAGRVELTINTVGAGSAAGSFPGLSLTSHTVLITYEYTDGTGTMVLATATSTVDLSSGSGSINFVAADYDLASHDTDGDGVSNAAELSAGTDPRDSTCVLDTSIIGSCTLG